LPSTIHARLTNARIPKLKAKIAGILVVAIVVALYGTRAVASVTDAYPADRIQATALDRCAARNSQFFSSDFPSVNVSSAMRRRLSSTRRSANGYASVDRILDTATRAEHHENA